MSFGTIAMRLRQAADELEQRQRAAAPISRHKQTKSVQMNLKVTPAFHARVVAYAEANDMSVIEVMERAFYIYATRHNGA